MEHDRILGYFLEEASEHLNTIEQGLLKLPETVKQPTTIRELFRAAHSIKGSAAMLGLLDIQKISNQFEANFKLLKEQPQIAVDSHLQSLFLQSFGFLKAGIEEVRVSSDPYRQDPATIDPIGDPVFEELKAYLQQLLAVEPVILMPDRNITDARKDPAIEQVFGEYVTRKLDEILGLCLQPDRPEVRAQIQQICQKLGNLGENFEFLEWTHLFTACRLATANPANFLPQLGESISVAVKQAQALVLTDRHQEISITADLEALIIGKTMPLMTGDLQSTVPLAPTTSPDRSNLGTQSLGLDATTEQLPPLISIGGTTLPLMSDPQMLDFESANHLFSTGAFPADIDADAMELNEFMDLLGEESSEGTWMQDDGFGNLGLPSIDLDDLANESFFSHLFAPVDTPTIAATDTNEISRETTADNLSLVPNLDEEETFYTPELGDLDELIPDFSSSTALSVAQHQHFYADLNPLDSFDSQLQPDLSPSLPLPESPVPDFGLDYPISNLFPTTVTIEESANLADLPIASISATETINVNRADDESLYVATTGTISTIEDLDSAQHHMPELSIPASRDRQPIEPEIEIVQQPEANFTDGSGDTSEILGLEELNNNQSSQRSDLLGLASFKNQKFPEAADLSSLENLTGTNPDATANLLSLDELDVLEPTIGVDLLFLESLDDGILAELPNLVSPAESTDPESEPDPISVADPISAELSNQFDGVINPDVGKDFDALDLTMLDERESTVSRSEGDPAINFELDSIEAEAFSQYGDDAPVDLDIDLFTNNPPVNELTSSDAPEQQIANDFTNFDLGASSDITNFELDIQHFDDLELNSEIENSFVELNLELPASTPLVEGAIAHEDAAIEWHDLADLDIQSSASLDLNSESNDRQRVNEIDPIEPATERDFDAIDPGALNLDLSAMEAPPSEQFNDLTALDIQLDNLGTEVSSNDDLSLDSLLGEISTDNLPDLGNLDALLGVTAAGAAGAALLMGASQSSALDDLDALVTTNPTSQSNLDALDALVAAPTPVIDSPVQPPTRGQKERRPKQSRTFEQTMRVSVRHLNNLNNLVGELVVNRNTLEQDQNRMRQFVEKLLSEVQKLNEVGKRMQDLYERSLMENSLVASRQQSKPTMPLPANGEEAASGGHQGIEYDPLEMDRFTPIHLLSQKMIELTVRVRESTADIEFVVDGSTEVTRTLRQITGQLQEDLTKSRMVPFAQTADRLQRGVRENGLKYGKQVELSVEGRDTLIDKVILESLTDPLIHMVNNAIAHGIEASEVRQAAGKSPEGKITIRALHQGNQTIISVSDDGAGIDTDRVNQKAIEKGIITAQQAAAMSKSETYELLFLPSFSTKDQADELAGRGVGMDVVRTSIAEIRGTIATESKLGVGTTFTIRLPLALSIAKALIAVNNKSNIAFPMDGIEDTQDVSPEQIQTDSDGNQCIFWRDELMPCKPLSDLLSFNRPMARNSFYSATEDDSDLVSILILRSDGNLTAVQVDKIAGDQEIVIKPLQGPAAKPLGIAGATVMGDGRIVPIADVMELIALANGTLSRQVSTQWTDQISAPTVEVRESMVLIVDDSITVRELLSLTFKRAGYRVEQARDGQEAWDKLRAGLPCDIVFCDIEMPRMDGLEFLSRIQKDTALSKVPVAMLTSRGSDRHRQIAAQLGASGYFIKPYLEEALLDAAKRMIKGEVLEIV